MKVVSYAFFRHEASGYESDRCGESRGRFFVNFLPALIRAHDYVWGPDWQLRIHHDLRVREMPYFQALSRMQDRRLLRLIDCGQADTLCGSMLWRLHPLFDPDVDYLVCRDVDSLPMPRDRRMVEQFLESRLMIHSIHDSQSHSGLMGGTCAFNAERFRRRFQAKSLAELLARGDGLAIDYNEHGADQRFLNGYVVPNSECSIMVHSARRPDMLVSKWCRPVAATCNEDKLANHVGGCYPSEDAKKYYDQHHPNQEILGAEA